jgi:type II secretion system protein N
MKARLAKILPWVGYPAFYLFCLFIFAYWTFPYERLRDRIVAEFERQQHQSGGTQRLTIDSLGPYWLSGLYAKGVRIVMPPPPGSDPDKRPAEIAIDEGHVRVSLLPLLVGRVSITFGAKAFGGNIDGFTTTSGDDRRLEVELDKVDLTNLDPIASMVGLPLVGTLDGKLDLTIPEQKLQKANGTIDVTIRDLAAGDGKAKIGGKLALPKLNVGELTLSGEAKDGVLKITKLAAAGQDLDLTADGKILLRDPTNESIADVYLRFKFADGYKNRNDMTKSLFGSPGSSMPALFELDPRVKQSKRSDGFYGWHMMGPLRDAQFNPAPAGSAPGGLTVPGINGTRPGLMRGFGQ